MAWWKVSTRGRSSPLERDSGYCIVPLRTSEMVLLLRTADVRHGVMWVAVDDGGDGRWAGLQTPLPKCSCG